MVQVHLMLKLNLINQQLIQVMFQLIDIDLFEENLIDFISNPIDRFHYFLSNVSLFYHLIKSIQNDI